MASRKATAVIQAKTVTIATRNEALPHGKSRKTMKSALAATETTAIVASRGHLAPRAPSSAAPAPRSQ